MTTRAERTVERLLMLIGHPRTGEEERDTARRMLSRIREAQHRAGKLG